MTDQTRRSRWTLTSVALATCLALWLPASAASAADEPSPPSSPGAAAAASPMPTDPFTIDLGYQLPDLLGDATDLPTVSIEPESTEPWEVGVAQAYALGHCGILSPIDVDGSLWEPTGGIDAHGGPIDSDEEIGELINATSGTLELTRTDQAMFLSDSGQQLFLDRASGALDYVLCM